MKSCDCVRYTKNQSSSYGVQMCKILKDKFSKNSLNSKLSNYQIIGEQSANFQEKYISTNTSENTTFILSGISHNQKFSPSKLILDGFAITFSSSR